MARRRPFPPILHLIVAMAVIMVPALLAIAWFTRIPDIKPVAVDPAPIIATAREQADYAVAAPVNLPEGWTCTRARWTPEGQAGLNGDAVIGDTFALGYVTPQQVYVGLDQRDHAQDAFVTSTTRTGRPDGAATVAGQDWQRYRSDDGRTRSLVLKRAEAVTIVSGDLPYAALEAFAGTLTFA